MIFVLLCQAYFSIMPSRVANDRLPSFLMDELYSIVNIITFISQVDVHCMVN